MKKILLLLFIAFSIINIKAITPQELTIYINPGHGGYDSDDRNVVIAPFEQGDPAGYWESKSNLVKGLYLRDMLIERGYNVGISRVTNTTADDLGLGVIGELANTADADFFLSIHSNATGTGTRSNFPLMLYRGYDVGIQTGAVYPESPVVANIVNKHLLKNEATVWTSTNVNVRGDWSFYNWGQDGLGVLRQLKMTGMLSEGSFHDYVPEAYRLMNNDFCWVEAWHFLKSLEEYYKIPGETVGYVAGVVYDSRLMRNEEYILHGRDKNIHINEVKVELCDASGKVLDTYITDNMNNGFFLFKKVTPGNYTIKVSKDTHIATQADVVVEADKMNYKNIAMQKIRNTAPEVVSYSPVWKEGDAPLLCNTPIIMKFNWDMDVASTEAAFTITPAVNGKFEWSDANYQLKFTPTDAFAVNTLYTVKLAKSAQHAGGMSMTGDVSFTFATDGRDYMQILSKFPHEGVTMHTVSPVVYISTDRPIFAPTGYQNIKVKDDAGNEISINSRGVSYAKDTEAYGWMKIPLNKALEAGKEYTVVYPNVIADKNGIHTKTDITEKFKAENLAVLETGAIVINDFEDATKFAVDNENSAQSTCELSKNTTKLFGTACLNLKYTFTQNSGGKTYVTSPVSTEVFTSNDILSLYVFGDISLNRIQLEMVSGDETKLVDMGIINYLGWQKKSVNLAQTLTSGKEYTLKGIILTQENNLQGLNGAVRFDNLVKLPNQGGIDDVNFAGITVYPNPASEYIIANGDALIEGLELFSIDGKKVSEISGNVMNVSEINNGTYILKIHVSGSTLTRKVMVSNN